MNTVHEKILSLCNRRWPDAEHRRQDVDSYIREEGFHYKGEWVSLKRPLEEAGS